PSWDRPESGAPRRRAATRGGSSSATAIPCGLPRASGSPARAGRHGAPGWLWSSSHPRPVRASNSFRRGFRAQGTARSRVVAERPEHRLLLRARWWTAGTRRRQPGNGHGAATPRAARGIGVVRGLVARLPAVARDDGLHALASAGGGDE